MHKWPPDIPARLAKSLAPFTFYAGGVCRWYRGKMVHVCGKTTPLDRIETRWGEKKTKVDGDARGTAVVRGGGATYRHAASLFYGYLEHRVKTRQPEPLSPYTEADYRRAVNGLGRLCGADRELRSYGVDDFTAYAKTFAEQSPSGLTRAVAYIGGFFRWCVDENLLPALPSFGRYFAKPAAQEGRDRRLGSERSFTPDEVCRLWEAATEVERLWICLGLNCGMDNADLANLTEQVIDFDGELIDYRRRKVGKVRRVIPLLDATIERLKSYERPGPADPSYGGFFLLTDRGLPLGRMVKSRKVAGRANPVDAVSRAFTRLMVRAGMRSAPTITREHGKRRVKFAGDSDGRGFRSFRHTFATLAPPGYREEVEIVLGHAQNSILVEHYIDKVGTKRLRELVSEVWAAAFTCPVRRGESSPGDAGKPAPIPA